MPAPTLCKQRAPQLAVPTVLDRTSTNQTTEQSFWRLMDVVLIFTLFVRQPHQWLLSFSLALCGYQTPSPRQLAILGGLIDNSLFGMDDGLRSLQRM